MNQWNSESHQARKNGRVVAEEDKVSNYDDIINLPHHVSKRHPQMSMWNRAAQFAPFAALNGYEDAIQESARKNESMYEEKTSLSTENDDNSDEGQACGNF